MADTEQVLSEKEKESIPDLPLVPRENLISTAVKFLQNPQVRGSALPQRKAFLQKKGLTDEEIQLAVDRSGTINEPQEKGIDGPVQNQHVIAAPVPSLWSRIKEFLSASLLVGGIGYAIYQLYKRYIIPYLFGPGVEEKKAEALQNCVIHLDESVKEIERALSGMRQSLNDQRDDMKQILQESAFSRGPMELGKLQDAQSVKEIKAEIASLKGLLLSRKQFPQIPKTAPVLPSWQLPLSDAPQEQNESEERENQTKPDSGKNSMYMEKEVESELSQNTGDTKNTANSEQSVQDLGTVQKQLSSTSVDRDFQNGVVVNSSASVSSTDNCKSSTANTNSNMEDP